MKYSKPNFFLIRSFEPFERRSADAGAYTELALNRLVLNFSDEAYAAQAEFHRRWYCLCSPTADELSLASETTVGS
jgi:hypothetical protein